MATHSFHDNDHTHNGDKPANAMLTLWFNSGPIMMLFSWQGWMSYSVSPFILFAIQLGLSHLFYARYLRHITPSLASGAVVMALGIFTMDVLPRLISNSFIMLLIAYEVLIIWLYLGILLIYASLEGRLSYGRMNDRLALGCWVAGSVITALMLDEVGSSLHGLIALIGIIGVLLYLVYLVIVVHRLIICWRKKFHVPVNGMILLAAVSTQAIALMLSNFFHEHIPLEVYQGLILLGYFFYFLGLYEIVRYLIYARRYHFVASWHNANATHFGAMSLTGVVIINSQAFPEWVVVATWWWAITTFFIVEGIEICQLILRIKKRGFKKTINRYHTSQWVRVFTFGVLYAFAVAYYNYEYPPNMLTTIIVFYGQYVVTALLIIELLLAIRFNMNQERKR